MGFASFQTPLATRRPPPSVVAFSLLVLYALLLQHVLRSDLDWLSRSLPPPQLESMAGTTPVKTGARAMAAPHELCVVYDAAPHTGTHRVARALHVCLARHAYAIVNHSAPSIAASSVPQSPSLAQGTPLRTLLAAAPGARRLALLRADLSIAPADEAALAHHCAAAFYVTGTRHIRDRLAEHVAAHTPAHVARARGDTAAVEAAFERYPFAGGARPMGGLRADFVLRFERLGDDLRELLDALACGRLDGDDGGDDGGDVAASGHGLALARMFDRDDLLQEIRLAGRDARHRVLASSARLHNDDGLQRARQFVAPCS